MKFMGGGGGIPPNKVSGSGNVQTNTTTGSGEPTTTVRKDEHSLADVAHRTGIPLKLLEEANPKLKGTNNLTAGQDVKLPQATQTKQNTSGGQTQNASPSSTQSGAKSKVGDHQLDGQLRLADLKKKEAEFLQDGRIDENEAKALEKGDKAYLKYMLEHDSFDAKGRKVIEKVVGKVDVPKNSVVGQQVAVLGKDKQPVLVSKEIGQPGGFATRYEALALARGANSKTAAIFQDQGKPPRWHAVETNVSLGPASKANWSADNKVGNLEFIDQPDLKKWTAAQQKVQELKKQGYDKNDPQLQEAYRDQIAAALGVPSTEINIIGPKNPADPSKINFDPNLPAYGRSGPAKLDGKPHTLQIGIGELGFDSPFNVISTAFHEATHVRHHARGNELLKQWEATDKGKTFGRWLDQQYNEHKISLEDKVTATAEYNGRSGPTEAVSYINSFIATFAIDRTDKNEDALMYSNLSQAAKQAVENTDLEKDLMGRLEKFYAGLDESDRTRFNTAMDKLKKEMPNSWLAKFQHQ
jgi:hypothetical protein